MAKSTDNIRVIYSDDPGGVDSVKKNPGKVFAVVGPFDGHADRESLRNAIEMVVRGHNYDQDR